MTQAVTASVTGVTFDPATIRNWLGVLHGDSPGFVSVVSTGDWSGRAFTPQQLDEATSYVAQLDAAGREGIYLRITSVTEAPAPGKRGSVEDSAALPALWADLDLAGPGHARQDLPPDEAAGRLVIASSGLPEPTIWVHSGGGLYPIWLLDRPHPITPENLDDAKRLAKDWQKVIEYAAASHGWGYGAGVGDLARVLRIPGTVNRKKGGAQPCRIIGATPVRYGFQQLLDALYQALKLIPQPATAEPRPPRPAGGGLRPGDDFEQQANWAEILEPVFVEHNRIKDEIRWRRHGKSWDEGPSATTNHEGTDQLHVFTDGAPPFEQNGNYSKFGAFALLHHGGDHSAAARALASQGYGAPTDTVWPLATPTPDWATTAGIVELPATDATSEAPTGRRPDLDVGNPAIMFDWLRINLGRGALAGMFLRGPDLVHTPQEGEEGYLAVRGAQADGDDGPAQVRAAHPEYVAARIQAAYSCIKLVKRGDQFVPTPALFPAAAAKRVSALHEELPQLRRLRGVIHTPAFRPDGSLIDRPGYDPVTRLLYLPEPGLTIPPISRIPTTVEVKAAVDLLGLMLSGFPFTSEHSRANYLGALVTPLLRAITPPPYKLVAIGAHQRGSGKTKLANLPRIIHGGVFRAETPEDEAELRKQVTAILSITTGPVIVFDNVSGVLRSSTMAGLLTSDEWGDRPLGETAWVGVPNDRLWVVTGNNLALGGDIPRRTVSVTIDPGIPRPELRTGFAIGDPEVWAKAYRAELLHALLTIVQAWIAVGMPVALERASDGYARWTRTVEAILTNAGIPGRFDHVSTQIEVGHDDDEWADFLAAVHRVRGDCVWTVKGLLADVDQGHPTYGLLATAPKPIPLDALPHELAEKATRAPQGIGAISKTLGRWLLNRDGRWAGNLAVRSAGTDRTNVKLWRIQSSSVDSGRADISAAGLAGFEGSDSLPRAREAIQDHLIARTGLAERDPANPANPAAARPQSPPSDPNHCPACYRAVPDAAWQPCDDCGKPTHARGRGSHGRICQTCLTERTAA